MARPSPHAMHTAGPPCSVRLSWRSETRVLSVQSLNDLSVPTVRVRRRPLRPEPRRRAPRRRCVRRRHPPSPVRMGCFTPPPLSLVKFPAFVSAIAALATSLTALDPAETTRLVQQRVAEALDFFIPPPPAQSEESLRRFAQRVGILRLQDALDEAQASARPQVLIVDLAGWGGGERTRSDPQSGQHISPLSRYKLHPDGRPRRAHVRSEAPGSPRDPNPPSSPSPTPPQRANTAPISEPFVSPGLDPCLH